MEQSVVAARNSLFMCLAALFVPFSTAAPAADLAKIDCSIAKEPAYKSKAPKYCLLLFGPEARDRVWLVLDGDTLYVDRNGNGDLTEPGEKVAAKVNKSRDLAEFGYTFEVGDLTLGGKVHKALTVTFPPLTLYASNPSIANFVPFQAALKADPKAVAATLTIDVESARLKGGGIGGRLSYLAGFYDESGVLQFADRPADAPIVYLDGPLQVTFYDRRPTLRLARGNDIVLMVGTPGHGPGTFAMLAYEGTIPESVYPNIEIAFPASQKDGAPVKERYELKERC